MEKKVFVVLVHRDHEDYQSSSDLYAVCSTFEKATEKMNECFNAEYKAWTTDYGFEKEDLDIKKGTNMTTIFDTSGCVEYTEITIEEKEID